MADLIPAPLGLRAVRRTADGVEVDPAVAITTGGRGLTVWTVAGNALVPAICDRLLTADQPDPTPDELDQFMARFADPDEEDDTDGL